MEQTTSNNQHKNRKLTFILLGAAVGMFGFGFALIPLYDILCEQLGINGKTKTTAQVAPNSPLDIDTSRLIRVEFISNIDANMPWKFEPEVRVMDVHPGEVIQTAFIATNQSNTALIGQAVPSVSPGLGASHFNKIECFCFNQQPLAGNAEARLPLLFYIENELPDSIHTLTLSYTLYNITESVDQVQESIVQVTQSNVSQVAQGDLL
jgi:cytochrome c oxidase assembly protein subunit 11